MSIKEFLIEKWRDFKCFRGVHDRNILSTRYIRIPNKHTQQENCYLIHTIVCNHCGKQFERVFFKHNCWEYSGDEAIALNDAIGHSSKSKNVHVE